VGEKGCYSAGSDQIRGCYSTPYTGLGRCRVSAEDGRTTADDAEQAFHRAVGGQREHKPIIGQFRCLSCRFKADYDALQLAFDSPWVYRSNYSFDLRYSAANMILGRVHPMCSTKCLNEVWVPSCWSRCGTRWLGREPVQRSWAPEVGCTSILGLERIVGCWFSLGSDFFEFILYFFFFLIKLINFN